MGNGNSEWAKEAKRNAQTIEAEIVSLESDHRNLFSRHYNYKAFWAHANRISSLFRELKPLSRESRETLWSRFSGLCDAAKKSQTEQRESRQYHSARLRSDILSQIEAARPNSLFGFDPPDMEEMKRLGEALRKAGQMLSENKERMLGEHKQECFQRIQEVRKAQDAWWEHLKQRTTEQRTEREERARRNLEKNYERHRKATEALAQYRTKADELRDKISTAWNEDWAEGAGQRLSELEDKIQDIERSISQIEDWIREDEGRL